MAAPAELRPFRPGPSCRSRLASAICQNFRWGPLSDVIGNPSGAGVVYSRLYDGSEQDPDARGYPHGQRTPERDAYYAWDDTCAAGARGQRTQKCQEEQ